MGTYVYAHQDSANLPEALSSTETVWRTLSDEDNVACANKGMRAFLHMAIQLLTGQSRLLVGKRKLHASKLLSILHEQMSMSITFIN